MLTINLCLIVAAWWRVVVSHVFRIECQGGGYQRSAALACYTFLMLRDVHVFFTGAHLGFYMILRCVGRGRILTLDCTCTRNYTMLTDMTYMLFALVHIFAAAQLAMAFHACSSRGPVSLELKRRSCDHSSFTLHPPWPLGIPQHQMTGIVKQPWGISGWPGASPHRQLQRISAAAVLSSRSLPEPWKKHRLIINGSDSQHGWLINGDNYWKKYLIVTS